MDGWRRPFTGAWIETRYDLPKPFPYPVAPSRGRGLKRFHIIYSP